MLPSVKCSRKMACSEHAFYFILLSSCGFVCITIEILLAYAFLDDSKPDDNLLSTCSKPC